MAFTQAMESRLKMKYGKQVPQLSSQMLLECNPMTEGCDGGWPHLHSYFQEQAYMVEESCAPYKSKTKGSNCAQYSKCKPIAKVSKTEFSGLGTVNEKNIMKEILAHGAIPADF
jgi:hypothetical protein